MKKNVSWCPRAYTAEFGKCIARVAVTPRKAGISEDFNRNGSLNQNRLRIFCVAVFLVVHHFALQEPLPGPREELQFDWTLGDAELFERFFIPMHNPSVDFIGDLWHDASCLNSANETD